MHNKDEVIKKEVMDDIILVNQIRDSEMKLKYLDEYKKILDDDLESWRNNVKIQIKYEKAYERVIKKHPDYILDEPLSAENMTPEILSSILIEIMLMKLENKK